MVALASAIGGRGRSKSRCRAVLVLLVAAFLVLSSALPLGAEEQVEDEKTQKERLKECKDLFAGRNYIMAMECCFEVVAMDPETEEGIEALYAAGVCYFRLKKYQEAFSLLQTIVDEYSTSKSFEKAKKMADETRKKMTELGIEPKPREEEKPPEEKGKTSPTKAISGPSGGVIDLHGITVSNVFGDTRLAEALHEVSQETGVRFIIDPAVGGVTSLEFEETPLDEALEAMLSPYGFVFKAEEDVVVVGTANPESPLFPRLAETQIYRPKNLTASEIPKLLPKFYEQFLSANSEKNILAISAPSDVMADTLERIQMVDVAQKQVMIELLVVEIKLVKGLQLGVDWSVSGDKDYHAPKPALKPSTLRSLAIDWNTLLGDIAYTSSADEIKAMAAKLNFLLDKGEASVRANPRGRRLG